MPATTASMIMPQQHQPQTFTDEELSEIFHIDFSEIFGSPDQGIKPSKYKGVQLPPSTTSSAQKSSVTNRNEELSSTRGNHSHKVDSQLT